MRVFEYLKEVSDRVSDQEPGFEFETWTVQQVLASLNAAYQALAGIVPDRFSTIVDVPLHLGDIQHSGCERLLGLLGLYNAAGLYIRTLESLSKVNPNVIKRLQKMNCSVIDNGPIAADIISAVEIRVYPPVTSQTTDMIKARCLRVPVANSVDDELHIPTDLRAAFQEFMLYYLYDIDSEGVPNRARSELHWTNAFALLGVGNDRSTKR